MEFVNFEISKKLKEKGFDEPCEMYYHIHDDIADCVGSLESTGGERNFVNSNNKYRCAAPTISQVLKWLREEKGIHIEIRLFSIGYGFDIIQVTDRKKLAWSGTYEHDTYEQSALAGIVYVLDNLI